jgi:O-antigen ligase
MASQTKFPKNNVTPVVFFGIPLVTLYFNPTLNDPFNVAKLILLILISSWLLVNFLLSLKEVSLQYSSTQTKMVWLVAIFLLAQLASFFLEKNFIVAIFGDTQRRNGFLGYFSLAIVLLYTMLSSKKFNPLKIFIMLLWTGSVVIAYSLVQITGNDFIKWNNPYNTAISTLGNPNFTSAFLAMVFMSAFFILVSGVFKFTYKIISILVQLLSLFVIYKSDSRQGFYAVAVSLLFYVNILFYIKRKKIRHLVTISTLILVLIAVAGMLQKGPLQSILYKDSVSIRGYYWRAGIRMFLDHPITGVGLDQYGAYYRQYKELKYVQLYGTELTSSNAHNTFIQLFATGGFLVGISYLSIIISILALGLKFLNSSESLQNKKIILGLLSIFVAYQAQSVISIDNLGISVWPWFIGGAILGYVFRFSEIEQVQPLSKIEKRHKAQVNLISPIFHFIVTCPVLIVCILLQRSEADMYILRGIADPGLSNNKTATHVYALKVLNNPIADPFLKLKAVLYLGDVGYVDEGYSNLKLLLEKNPTNYENLWSLATFQTQLNYTEEAINCRLQIASIDKFNTKNYLELLKLYKYSSNQTEATKMKNTILEIASTSVDAQEAQILIG